MQYKINGIDEVLLERQMKIFEERALQQVKLIQSRTWKGLQLIWKA
jgi:hypothetical protein